MSLPILAAMVAGGVASIVALIHFTGGSRLAELVDADAARARFAVDFPAERAVSVVLTADRHAAVLDLGPGRVGLVHAVGRHFLTRVLADRDVASVSRDGAMVHLRLTDFTFEGGVYDFGSADVAAKAEAILAVPGLAGEAA